MESQHVEHFRTCILSGKFEELFKPIANPTRLEVGSSLTKIDEKTHSEDSKTDSLFGKVTACISAENRHILMYFIFEQ
jgi:hypothetical protein